MSNTTLFGHPRAVFLIAALQLWESFSYYGMRSILILFLTGSLMYSDENAYTLYAVYICLVEIGGVVGGLLADKYFGARKSIGIGAVIITLGHFCMLAIPFSPHYLLIALSLIATGSALFRVNCATMLAEFYQKDDPKLKAGYTIYYCSLNVGAFFSMMLCGLVAETFGWHYGFALAGIGMLIGLCCFIFKSSVLEDKDLLKAQKGEISKIGVIGVLLIAPISLLAMNYAAVTMELLPFILIGTLFGILGKLMVEHPDQKRNIFLILIATLLLSLFYACGELVSTSMVLFAERLIDRNFLGFTIPSSTLTSVNPVTIIIFGLFLSRFFGKVSSFKSISYAFIIMSLAFILLLFGNLLSLIGSFMLIAIAELFIGPVVYTLCKKLAPENTRGQSMGVVMLGYSLAGLMSGHLGKTLMIGQDGGGAFYNGFTMIFIMAALTGLVLLGVNFVKQKII